MICRCGRPLNQNASLTVRRKLIYAAILCFIINVSYTFQSFTPGAFISLYGYNDGYYDKVEFTNDDDDHDVDADADADDGESNDVQNKDDNFLDEVSSGEENVENEDDDDEIIMKIMNGELTIGPDGNDDHVVDNIEEETISKSSETSIQDDDVNMKSDDEVLEEDILNKWWKGQDSNATRRNLHPHKGALLHNMTGMIVDPSPDRIRPFFNGDELFESKQTVNSKALCPKDGKEYGIEGKGGYKTLQKVRTGLLESIQRNKRGGDDDSTTLGKNKRRSRILCMVYTAHFDGDNHANLRAQAQTWGRHCDGFFGASNYTDHSIGAIDLLHEGIEDYSNMWQKIRSMWAYAYNHYRDEYDFFYICGDDTYVIVENLRAYVDGPEVEKLENGHIDRIHKVQRGKTIEEWAAENKTMPLVLATPIVHKGCPSPAGGSGYVLNRAALDLFGSRVEGHFANSTDSREDLFMGGLFCTEDVFVSDTQHETKGGWRFADTANNIYYYEGVSPISPKFLEHKFGFEIRKGIDSVSHDAISFHLKADKSRGLEEGYTIADLPYRYEVVLYDMCNKLKKQ